MNEKNYGITLIVLVITIIVLLLLAGVTIAMLTGDNGILGKSRKAEQETNEKEATEIINLKITNAQMQTYAKEQRMPTLKELAIALDPGTDKDMKSVSKTRQKVSSLDWVNDTDYQSIFAILNDYPEYEFEIDSSLKLASINGVKIADNTNKEVQDHFFTGTELLEKTEIVDTTTDIVVRNKEISLKNSIEDYEFLLFKFGCYDQTKQKTTMQSTLLISVDDIEYISSTEPEGLIHLNAAFGTLHSAANINFKDNKTVRIYNTTAATAGRKYFAIDSIKGIK